MTDTHVKPILTATALALAIMAMVAIAQPAAAQSGSGTLTVREAPLPLDQDMVKRALETAITTSAEVIKDHVETMVEGQQELIRCRQAAGPGAREAEAHAARLLACFVDQAATNEEALNGMSREAGHIAGTLLDSAENYDVMAKAKAAERRATEAEIERVIQTRVETGRRISRVAAFMRANQGRLEGERFFEARRIQQDWTRQEQKLVHLDRMRDYQHTVSERFANTALVFRDASMNMELTARDLSDRGVAEGYYITEVTEAALVEVALRQTDHVMTNMSGIGSSIDAVLVALGETDETRLQPVLAEEEPEFEGSGLFTTSAQQKELEDFFLNFPASKGDS